ncbi:MAG TPA: CBS domain-containing protein [Acidisoma sp.]|jgi:CBS domain-containing protein|nr:CBS domain-containing protein [Acidisoma sp.]
MTVAAILAQKDSRVISVSPDTHVGDVARVLQENSIGAVLVMEEDSLLGILSERGIVRAMAVHRHEVVNMPARDVLTPPKYTTTVSATIEDSMQVMIDGKIRYLPIFESNKLIGLLSIGDLVAASLRKRQHEASSLTGYITGSP